MKYSSTILDHFAFHDAEMQLVRFSDGSLIVSVKHLNIHGATPQNHTPIDMELSLAYMTFRDFRVESFEPGRAWHRDSKGSLYTDDPLIIYKGKEAENHLLDELREQICVYSHSLEPDGNGLYHMDACGSEPWFTTQFAFSSAIIEWDEYRCPAWYEK